MSSSPTLALSPTVPHKCYFLRNQSALSPFIRPSFSLHVSFRSLTCRCSADREEDRWLREEQRWLREEQRWLREEQRWARERDSLLREISDLRLQIQSLERRILASDVSSSSSSSSSVSDAIANVTALLQVLKDKNDNLIAESGSSSREMVLEEKRDEEEEIVKEVTVQDTAWISDRKVEKRVENRSALRTGSEGEEVREMQEALLNLGFYSGEEDMEYSSFSSGTERAVKTWQAASGVPEDGIMTAELLEKLYMEIRFKDAGVVNEKENYNTVSPEEVANGAPVASMAETSEFQQTIVGDGDAEIDVSHQRVFLLGENRWEEPSRLRAIKGVDKGKTKDGTTQCHQCRGEGRLLCTECDGTGEPNIEPQFLEWVVEAAKCPYCEGLGYTICDLCAGKIVI
ncbi:protein disulfide isomerase pTAC5, chloroplastic [Neltuma alba]|uniref:protein disulfide isomerase pTAC5, chloroplastic n=1 Tax=Neltuma alba TaxID=207710 RepID=UPI0010A3A63E|nr:protein disulfide isomerase pTAC5, chloroplastic [Prosopis alba]XP_028773559.1 protein disulfide isomerase pTAC5, chloroplastic [Prosopis alba]XP_028773560.1 protein disulfide isomerase pTAC5, chloroplastic [Prosopis alba]